MLFSTKLINLFATSLLTPLLVTSLPIPNPPLEITVQAKTLQNQEAEANQLYKEGCQALEERQYQIALKKLQQALKFYKQTNNSPAQGNVLKRIGFIYASLGQNLRALEYYQQALAIRKRARDQTGQGESLNDIGFIRGILGQYAKALEFHQQALAIRKAIADDVGQGQSLKSIGFIYASLGRYQRALECYQQALAIRKRARDQTGQGESLNDIGFIHALLGQDGKALEFYQQALAIREQIGDKEGQAQSLNSIGGIYHWMGRFAEALEVRQKALAIRQQLGDLSGQGQSLNSIGFIYSRLKQYAKALEFYQQALAIRQQSGERAGEVESLNDIGVAYSGLEQYAKALEFHQLALAVATELDNKTEKGQSFKHIGFIYATRNQSATAINFLKQAVNIYETIRQDNKPLTREQQESYTKTVEPTYRKLADLLLSQGRLLEAQQVLELLKFQEINRVDWRIRAMLGSSKIDYTTTETEIRAEHGSLIALGEKIYSCEKQQKQCDDRQLKQWQAQRERLTEQFEQTVTEAEERAKERLNQSSVLGKDDFIKSYQSIVEAQLGTLLVYPFVTNDKIWLLWASAGGVLSSTQVPNVGREKLLKAVKEFRDLINKPPGHDPAETQKLQQVSQQLYQWLIQPLEPALESNHIKHLVFSLDSTTRYIPMSALFDGKQYLIQRYTVSTVLNASLTVMDERLPQSPQAIQVLALGVSRQFPNFPALTYVPEEINTILQVYPGDKFLDQTFTEQTLTNNLKGQKIIHIATHADFQATNPKNSFLLLGDGKPYPIRQIQFLRNLGKVHLVVLSACETGLSETDPDGKEILGISAYFTGGNSKAKAVLASLWKVNDASTSLLMQKFYHYLATGKTKSEALQLAQLEMIQSKSQSNEPNKPRSSVNYTPGQNQTTTMKRDLSHPYYWAPFILIGNGL